MKLDSCFLILYWWDVFFWHFKTESDVLFFYIPSLKALVVWDFFLREKIEDWPVKTRMSEYHGKIIFQSPQPADLKIRKELFANLPSRILQIKIYIYTSLYLIWYMHIPHPISSIKCPSRWPVQTGFYKYRPSDFESNPKVLWREIPVVNDPLLREKVPQGFGDDSSLLGSTFSVGFMDRLFGGYVGWLC